MAELWIEDASEQGDLDRVQMWLKKRPDLVSCYSCGRTPLFLAAKNGHKQVVALLLANGAKVNDPNDGKTPLRAALENCHRDVVELLRNHGGTGYTGGICEAAEKGDLDDVAGLLRFDPRLAFRKGSHEDTPLHRAVSKGHEDVAKLMMEFEADVNAKNYCGSTPLHSAKTEELVKMLVAKGADINAKDHDGNTPLHVKAKWGYEEGIIRQLVASGADVTAKNKDYMTPMALAIREGRDELVPLLTPGGKVFFLLSQAKLRLRLKASQSFASISFWRTGIRTYGGPRLPRKEVAVLRLEGFSQFGGVDVIVGDNKIESARVLEIPPGNVTVYFYPRNTGKNASADSTHRSFVAKAGKRYKAQPIADSSLSALARGLESRLELDPTGRLARVEVSKLPYQVAISEV